MDDILIHGETEEIYDQHLNKALKIIELTGLILNECNCKFRQDRIRFLGHVIDKEGVRPDPEKVASIVNFPQPNITELKRFLGMANYLAKYVPELSTVGRPLYALLKRNTEWLWEEAQQEAFQRLKDLLVEAPVLVSTSPKNQQPCQQMLAAMDWVLSSSSNMETSGNL